MTSKKIKTYMNWSSGKDAALALYYLLQDTRYETARLITTVNEHYDRVVMHGLRKTLLEQQAELIGIPSCTVALPKEPDMETYEHNMSRALKTLVDEGFRCAAFGDIFLDDLRSYREDQLKKLNIQTIFPLWKRNTTELIEDFLNLGFKAIVVCVKAETLDDAFVGREVDRDFLNALPSSVDPCGENGEFHTFCFDGPIFASPVQFTVGDKVYRTYTAPKQDHVDGKSEDAGFWFCDLLPKNPIE